MEVFNSGFGRESSLRRLGERDSRVERMFGVIVRRTILG
jgi:hypothetical protein